MIPVILSGGNGSRFWSPSRKQYPKQFLVLTGDDTLFQQTIKRLAFDGIQTPLLVCNREHRLIAQEQLEARNLASQAILLEPFGRNTASAVAIAAMKLVAEGRDELLLILPVGRVIEDQCAFQQALALTANAAEKGKMVLFGISASRPETGYDYIHANADAQLPEGASRVQSFAGKPSETHAHEFVAAGGYYWNSGMFLFHANRYLEELKKHDADIYDTCLLVLERSRHDGGLANIDTVIFECRPDNSTDYAVMEKTSRACVVSLSVGQNDVGSWSLVWDVYVKDANGNVTKGDVLVHGSHNCLMHSNGKLVSVIDLEDIAVVEIKDAVMTAHKDRVRDVKHMAKDLDVQGRSETQNHCEVHRPWGFYDLVDMGGRLRVKHITVKSGARLSLQVYHHRAGRWIVVSGTAQATCDDKTFLLTENQSTYIPIASVHRPANPGKIPLEIIEMQSGSYLGEDDIERLEGVCGRTAEPAP